MKTVKVLVAYESMYGNTAMIAHAIGSGFETSGFETVVAPIDEVTSDRATGVDLLVVGGPTHVHGMSRDTTRASAAKDERNSYEHPTVTPGIRAWLDGLPEGNGRPAVAFDTRLKGPMAFTGSAAKGIGRQLRHHGFRSVAPPQSFLVAKDNTLIEGEAQRAQEWAAGVAGAAVQRPATTPSTTSG